MFACLISEFNRHIIEAHNYGKMPDVMFGYARYIVMPGFGRPNLIVDESDLCANYEITTEINKRGRYCVLENETAS